MNDEEINKTLKKVIKGDIDSYWYIVDKHKLLVSSYLASVLFNKSDIDDLTQEKSVLIIKTGEPPVIQTLGPQAASLLTFPFPISHSL